MKKQELLKFKRKNLKLALNLSYTIHLLRELLKILIPGLLPTPIKSEYLSDFKAPKLILKKAWRRKKRNRTDRADSAKIDTRQNSKYVTKSHLK